MYIIIVYEYVVPSALRWSILTHNTFCILQTISRHTHQRCSWSEIITAASVGARMISIGYVSTAANEVGCRWPVLF